MLPSRCFILLMLIVPVSGVGCHLCKTEVLNKSVSPDGKWTAETISGDCGAMSSGLVRVNVRPRAEKSASFENNVFVVSRGHSVTATWKDNASLTIECRDCTARDVETKLERHGPIQVVYDLP
jgi:hypothetical protein